MIFRTIYCNINVLQLIFTGHKKNRADWTSIHGFIKFASMTKLDIIGTYRKDGNGFFNINQPFKLVKAKRPPTNNKTPEFLILKPCCGKPTLPDGSKERYVSGIFWKTSNTFNIDFEGSRYIVEVLPDGFNLKLLGTEDKGL